MGGTSTDVCLIRRRRGGRSSEREVGGLPLRLPTVDLQTVGAGGGSIVWRDPGGALRVGPESAGADPGPACYGRGGTRPTVTDANLLLGRLPARAGGRARARPRARPSARSRGSTRPRRSRSSTRRCCARCGSSRSSAATTRGSSRSSPSAAPARCTPARSPKSSGSRRCSCRRPRASSRRSALPSRDERRDSVRSYLCPLAEAGELPREGEAELRYRGQSFELAVPLQPGLAEAFHRAHEARYGYADREREIELVAVRTAEVRPGPRARAPSGRAAQVHGPGASSSSRAPRAGFPQGGWGLGMEPVARCGSRNCHETVPIL